MHDASDSTASPLSRRLMRRETHRRCRSCGRTTRQVRIEFDINLSPRRLWLAPLVAVAEWLGNPWDCQECPRMMPATTARDTGQQALASFATNPREAVGALG